MVWAYGVGILGLLFRLSMGAFTRG
jgi:hypothetical protein